MDFLERESSVEDRQQPDDALPQEDTVAAGPEDVQRSRPTRESESQPQEEGRLLEQSLLPGFLRQKKHAARRAGAMTADKDL